jgi:hypothetical protein
MWKDLESLTPMFWTDVLRCSGSMPADEPKRSTWSAGARYVAREDLAA